MRSKAVKFIIPFLSILFILLNANVVIGRSVELGEKFELSQEPEQLIYPRDFCVTEDELIIIPDYRAGDIKIYEKKGTLLELIKIIGKKGYGKGEFQEPAYCFYNGEKGKFGVIDFGLRKIFIYDRIERLEFKRVREIYCWYLANDIKLVNDNLLISGYKPDRNERPHDFYSINLKNNQTTFLLESHLKYGFKSHEEYVVEYREKPGIKAIGIDAFFDVQGANIYFAWVGDLKVIKINIEAGVEENPTAFGKKAGIYVKPFASKRLLDGHSNRDSKITKSERARMSFVRDVFTTPQYILVAHEGPDKHFRLQFYNLKGDFLDEVPIPGQPDRRMYFDKNTQVLYSLSKKQKQEKYFILKYFIN